MAWLDWWRSSRIQSLYVALYSDHAVIQKFKCADCGVDRRSHPKNHSWRPAKES